MSTRGKVMVTTVCVSVVAGLYVSYYSLSLVRPVSVFQVVRTNAPVEAISADSPLLIPTNNWVVAVPFSPGSNSLISANDFRVIRRLGVVRGWWPARIERIVVDSDDWARIEYPTDSKTYFLHELTVIKEDGAWRILGERKLRSPEPNAYQPK